MIVAWGRFRDTCEQFIVTLDTASVSELASASVVAQSVGVGALDWALKRRDSKADRAYPQVHDRLWCLIA